MPKLTFRQQTFEFTSERAGIHFITKMRHKFGRQAKLFLKSVGDKTYVKARFPDDGSEINFITEARRHVAMRVNQPLRA